MCNCKKDCKDCNDNKTDKKHIEEVNASKNKSVTTKELIKK